MGLDFSAKARPDSQRLQVCWTQSARAGDLVLTDLACLAREFDLYFGGVLGEVYWKLTGREVTWSAES